MCHLISFVALHLRMYLRMSFCPKNISYWLHTLKWCQKLHWRILCILIERQFLYPLFKCQLLALLITNMCGRVQTIVASVYSILVIYHNRSNYFTVLCYAMACRSHSLISTSFIQFILLLWYTFILHPLSWNIKFIKGIIYGIAANGFVHDLSFMPIL